MWRPLLELLFASHFAYWRSVTAGTCRFCAWKKRRIQTAQIRRVEQELETEVLSVRAAVLTGSASCKQAKFLPLAIMDNNAQG